MENLSPRPKKPLKSKRKFVDADAFLDAVTPNLIENLDQAETAENGADKKTPPERTVEGDASD